MFALRSSATGALAIIVLSICTAGVNGKPPSRIAGGSEVMPGDLKYVVAVMRDGVHICGGAIISKWHILTAGHCLENPRNLSVVSNIVDLNDSHGTVHIVSAVIVHPQYSPYSKYSNAERDIAIIVLAEELTLDGKLSEVNIPWFQIPPGQTAMVAGWGYTSSASTSSSRLMKLYVQFLNEKGCRERRGLFTPDRLCGFSPYGTICGGDSGGPLVSGNYIVGIASASTCTIGDAHVYTNVFYYRDWINDAVRETWI